MDDWAKLHGVKLSPWDVRLGLRTLSLSLVTVGIAFVVDAVTGERGLPGAPPSIGDWPVVPVAAAVAAAIAIAPARIAGELSSLVALGVEPLRTRLAAVVVAASLSGFAGAYFGARGDVASMFPAPMLASDVRVEGERFVSPRKGIAVDETDALIRLREAPIAASAAMPTHRRMGAGLALALAGASLALYLVAPVKRTFQRAALTIIVYGTAQVWVFQLAGANRWPALFTGAPAVALLLVVGLELLRSATLQKPSRWI